MRPSSGETTVFMRHPVLVILYGRLSGMQGGVKYLNIVVSPDDGQIVARNINRKEINILREIVHQVGLFTKSTEQSSIKQMGILCLNSKRRMTRHWDMLTSL